MARWVEKSLSPSPIAEPQPEYMSMVPSMLRFNRFRYAAPNNGHIEVMNDSDEDEPVVDFVVGIDGEKKRVIRKQSATGSKRKRKSNESQESQVEEPVQDKPPVRPNAPMNPAIPATLAHRQKHRHHPGGWHGRTILETKAMEQILSEVRFHASCEHLKPTVANILVGASQTTLRLIADDKAEYHHETVEECMKEAVKRFNAADNLFKAKWTCIEIDPETGKPLEPAVKKQKKNAAKEPLLDSALKAEAYRMLDLVDEKLARPLEGKTLSNGIGEQVEGNKVIDFVREN